VPSVRPAQPSRAYLLLLRRGLHGSTGQLRTCSNEWNCAWEGHESNHNNVAQAMAPCPHFSATIMPSLSFEKPSDVPQTVFVTACVRPARGTWVAICPTHHYLTHDNTRLPTSRSTRTKLLQGNCTSDRTHLPSYVNELVTVPGSPNLHKTVPWHAKLGLFRPWTMDHDGSCPPVLT